MKIYRKINQDGLQAAIPVNRRLATFPESPTSIGR